MWIFKDFNFSVYAYRDRNMFVFHFRFLLQLDFCILFFLTVVIGKVKDNKIIISDTQPQNSQDNEQSVSVPKEFKTAHIPEIFSVSENVTFFFFLFFFCIKGSERLHISGLPHVSLN